MKKIGFYAAFVFLILGLFVFGIQKYIHKLPKGPYKKTCRKCFVVSEKLHCECHEHDDEWNVQNLPKADQCRYSIINDHGKLKCIPSGPYLETCARCWMSGDTLYCMACENRRGQNVQLHQRFSLPYVSRCRYDIVNNNVELNCLPPGQYLRYCSHCRIENNILRCDCSMTPNQKLTLHSYSINLQECKKGSIFYDGVMLKCVK